MNYPNMIKELRMTMLLTQQEFAEKCGVSFETVNRWENGKNEPTMKYKRVLAEMFKEHNIAPSVEDQRNEK